VPKAEQKEDGGGNGNQDPHLRHQHHEDLAHYRHLPQPKGCVCVLTLPQEMLPRLPRRAEHRGRVPLRRPVAPGGEQRLGAQG